MSFNRITKSSLTGAIGVAFVSSAMLPSLAWSGDNPFEMLDLDGGYMLAGDEDKDEEGKCGEGKCGSDIKDAKDESKGEEGKCGEGKCGGDAKSAEEDDGDEDSKDGQKRQSEDKE